MKEMQTTTTTTTTTTITTTLYIYILYSSTPLHHAVRCGTRTKRSGDRSRYGRFLLLIDRSFLGMNGWMDGWMVPCLLECLSDAAAAAAAMG